MSEHPQLKARELTEAERQALVDAAFDVEREIKASLTTISADTWSLAEQLYRFHEMLGWRQLGYETLNEFLAQPEIGISRSSYFRLSHMWRDLVQVRKVATSRLAEIDPSKVQEVHPAIMRGDVSPEAALADAKVLGARDLREKYRDPKSVGADTPLAAELESVRSKCPCCGEWTTTTPPMDVTVREDGVIELRKAETAIGTIETISAWRPAVRGGVVSRKVVTCPVPAIALQRAEAAASLCMSVDSFDRHVKTEVRCIYRGELRLYLVADLNQWAEDNAVGLSE